MGKQRLILASLLGLVIAAIVLIVQVPTQLGLDLRGGTQLTMQVSPTAEIPNVGESELAAVQRVIENRVNGLGVSEAVVQSVGQDQLSIQLPGVSDPEQAERVLGGTAQLEFRSQKPGTEGALAEFRRIEQQQLAQQQLLLESGGDQEVIAANQTAIVETQADILNLFEESELTGDKLSDAIAGTNGTGAWQVDIIFNSEGGDLFAQLTRDIAGTGRGLGIFLDNQLISAPRVDVEYAQLGIPGGRATISGGFDVEAARDLEIQLRGGSLPLPVEIVENRTVGATLGRDSVERSLYAALFGLALVLVFMAVYYRLPGVLADIALVVYAILTFAAYNLLGVTLTLPGIAGFILSIGMAVDANVLIFERTREEMRAGKTLYRSVESGFYRAFSSILDSNVTTLIACGALFFLGTGLVKGFALTLAIGVLVSMFTAVSCSRTLLFFAIGFPQFRKPQLFCPGIETMPRGASSAAQ
ncbi:protein translocase subunit SecD [cf. Phormidesmis sp. LEGE 11477]|uniref:protein translocase subunit SecD n=1 Tax=cf. Phormidesmis sp. LEGE 11477 TaxID=1828680 RepID=UPI00187DF54A|nr:protein translocase subunit SecD [cf. Phormidesmis sp. LEGE 11477]MBE9063225.1 protein translocase subunit SecD [cf. Phormidesmis sp. LEGE 11477]